MGKTIPQAPRELPETGLTPAICKGFIDLGTQTPSNPDWNPSRKCAVIWELTGQRKSDGRPFENAQFLGYSADSRSGLMKMSASWLGLKKGADVDTDSFLGRAAMVNITHSDDGQYANIDSVVPLPKGQKPGKLTSATFSLYLDESFDQDTFDSLTQKMKEKIEASPEYQELQRTKKPAKKEPVKKAAPAPAAKGKKK